MIFYLTPLMNKKTGKEIAEPPLTKQEIKVQVNKLRSTQLLMAWS